ncbi:GNAT family N-acetyltransferase [Ascidiimonas sp. W6]|uniref:GNAT family N-acetyltransferase n=1 Tax=Ascidiimonas meishanensis TaxID=3128903 RepID=UPI0030EC7905
MPQLLTAVSEDAKTLTELTMLSKGHWGYTLAQLKEWADELTITEHYLKKFKVHKLIEEGEIVGYYSWAGRPPLALLDNLFIHPDHLSKGYGRILLEDFLLRVKAAGFEKVKLDADPNAADFYTKFGFVKVGQLESSIPGRFLPVMERKV